MNFEQEMEILDDKQKKIVFNIGKPLRILAGAGTGKTKVITQRIAYAVHVKKYKPKNILSLTFSTQAALEIDCRLKKLGIYGVQSTTFHSAALRQVKYFWSEVFNGSISNIIQDKSSLISEACLKLGIFNTDKFIKEITYEIDWAKVNMLTPGQYMQKKRNININQELVAKIYESFENLKNSKSILDMEDILLLCSAIIEKSKKIARIVRQQYKHFTVDEFQDVSLLQYSLLKSWLGSKNQDICIVGDPNQSIYSFNGANKDFLVNFHNDFPLVCTKKLTKNYRSTSEIINFANKVMSKSKDQYINLDDQNIQGKHIEYNIYNSDKHEAKNIIADIKDRINKGIDMSDIAILYRTNSQSILFEEYLSKVCIPYKLFDQNHLQKERKMNNLINFLKSYKDYQYNDSTYNVICRILKKHNNQILNSYKEYTKFANIIISFAQKYISLNKNLSLKDFLNILIQNEINFITLSSLHAIKGLEFKHVYLVGVQEGLIPISYAKTKYSIEEERKLLYVAITRAKETLKISYAKEFNGHYCKKSRFLTF